MFGAMAVATVLLGTTAAQAQTLSLTGSNNTSAAFAHTDEGLLCDAERTTGGPTVVSSGSTSFRLRLQQFIASDCAQVSGPEPMTGAASYNLSFTAQCPVGYRLTVNTQRRGALIANQEEGEGTGLADLTAVSGNSSMPLASGTLALADLPAQQSGSDKCLEFDQAASGTIVNVSNGSPVAHSLDFSWSGNTDSQGGAFNSGDEGCVIMGLTAGGDFPGLDCDNYPNLDGGCAGGRVAANDGHFSEVVLTCLCGDGVNDGAPAGEECDEGAANGTAGSCCTSSCKLKPAPTECRAGGGECNPAEVCNGVSGSCPADGFTPAGTDCTDSSPSNCFAAQCNGSGSCNQTQGFEPNTLECRGAAGLCDVAELCTGASGVCPTDEFLAVATECRSAANECDVAETCTGANAFCPADGFQPGGTQCSDSASGDCFDAQCNGSGTCNQSQAFESDAYTCRSAAGLCDEAEVCSGASGTCPTDDRVDAATVCRGALSECDLAEVCDGTSVACPVDAFVPVATDCTDLSPGDCNRAQCDGVGACSQSLNLESAGHVCRSAAGECDAAETCDGIASTCPANGFQSAGIQCTDSSSGDCFDAQCDGSGTCNQSQALENNGTVCRPTAGLCDVAEACNGVGSSCPPDQFLDDATQCRAAAGECDEAEWCSGSVATCPANSFVVTGAPCTDSNEGDCFDAQCNGAGQCNQSLGIEDAGYVCRDATDLCDAEETCDGIGGACPADALEPALTLCRPAVDAQCDIGDFCTGIAAACPVDVIVLSGTVCNDDNGCTALDSCQAGVCTGGSAQSCSDGIVCTEDICLSTGPASFTCDNTQVTNGNCLIDGACVAGAVNNIASECQHCDPGTSQTDWSDKAENTLCSLGFGLCDGMGACTEPTPVCPPHPRDDCRSGESGRGKVVLRDKSPTKDNLDAMVWKLTRTNADFNDFGDPIQSTSYALCMYDSRASDPNDPPDLIRSMVVPAGGLCNKPGKRDAACWKSIVNRKYLYRDQRNPPPNDGIRKMILTSSSKPDRATIVIQAKGVNLQPPPLPLEGNIVFQLLNSRTELSDVCWEASYAPPFFKADGATFIDKSE